MNQRVMEKLTFKQYLESKERLREAVKNLPKRTATFNVKKYCKLVVGETKEQKRYVPLKPKQKIHVDLLYEDVDNPSIQGIRFEGVKHVNPDSTYSTYWTGEKLLQWLGKNTHEIFPK